MTRNDLLGTALAATATLLVGSLVAVSGLIADYPALGGQAVRYVLSSVTLAAILRLRGSRAPRPRLGRHDAALLVALALTGLVGFNLFVLAALDEAEPAAVGVIVGCVPVLLAIAGPALRGRSPHGRVLVAAVVVSAGAAVVQGAGDATARGLLLATGALAGEAAFSLLAVPLLPRLGPLLLSTYVCVLAATQFAVAAVIADGTDAFPLPDRGEAFAIAYLALAVTAGAFVAWYGAVTRIGVERAGLFAGLIPLGALLVAPLVGTGTITPLRLLGCAVVGAGIVLGLTAAGTDRPDSAPFADSATVAPDPSD